MKMLGVGVHGNLSLLHLIIKTQWEHLGPDKGPSLRLKIVHQLLNWQAKQLITYLATLSNIQAHYFHWTSAYNILGVVNMLLKPESGSSVIKGSRRCACELETTGFLAIKFQSNHC